MKRIIKKIVKLFVTLQQDSKRFNYELHGNGTTGAVECSEAD